MDRALVVRVWAAADDDEGRELQHRDYTFALQGKNAPLDRGNWVNVPLFRDDRLSTAVHKIRNGVPGLSDKDTLYLWAGVEPADVPGYCNRLVGSVFRGARRAPLKDVMGAIRCVFPKAQAAPQAHVDPSYMLDYLEAHKLALETLRGSRLDTRLLFDYSSDIAYRHVFPANPALATQDHLSAQPLVYVSRADSTLWDAGLGPEDDAILNVMSRRAYEDTAGVPGLADLYFPPELAVATKHGGHSLTAVDGNAYSRLLQAATGLHPDTLASAAPHYRKLYASVHPVGQPLSFRLRSVFNRFTLDAVCPLLVYRAADQVVYKADMAALQGLDPWLVRYWTRAPTAKVESLMFKVVYKEFFATLILFPLLVYHVKLTFRTTQHPDSDYVHSQALPAINAVLQRVRDMVAAITTAQGIELPLLTPESLAPENLLQVNFSAKLEFAGSALPPLHAIEARMLALPGLFHRVPILRDGGVRSGSVQLRYLRCSNYNALADIEAHITSMSQSSMSGAREDIIAAVGRTYSLSHALAGDIYDRVMERAEGSGTAYRSRYFEGISVEVVRLSDRTLQLHVRGAKIDPQFALHIGTLTAALLSNTTLSAAGIPRSPATTKSPAAAEVRRSLRMEHLLGDGAEHLGSPFDEGDAAGSEFAASLASEEPSSATSSTPPSSEAEDADNLNDSLPPAKDSAQTGFAPLARLKRADPNLFAYEAKNQNYKSYASNCAANAHRQPIVVSKEEAASLKKSDPSAYTNAVHAGSTPALRQANVYICPDVWCPDSELAMGLARFRRQGCPKEGEQALVMTDGARQKYVSFLDPSRHPRELCAPCCFFVDHSNQSKGRKHRERMARCQQASDENKDEAEESGEDTTKDLYVRGLVFPLEKGRFGRLPPALSKFLQQQGPGGCSKLGGAPCYVRLGISHGGQYFMSAVAAVLGEPGGAAGLAEKVSRMDPAHFVAMNSGSLLRVFAPSEPRFERDEYGALKEWLQEHPVYVGALGMEALVAELGAVADPSKLAPDTLAKARREHIVMLAMQNFANYLRAPTPKDHTMLLEIFCMWHRVVDGADALNILVVEEDADTGKLQAACLRYSFYSDVAAGRNAPSAMILKHRQFYEPVAWASASGHSLRLDSGQHWQVERVRDAVLAACGAADTEFPAARALSAIKGAASVAMQVVGGDYRAVGVVTEDGAYVPLPAPCRIHPDIPQCVHATDVLPRLRSRPLAAAIALFKRLARDLGPFYIHQVHPAGTALLLGEEQVYVPVVMGAGPDTGAQHSAFLEEHLDDLRIFVGEQLPNGYFSLAAQAAAQADVLAGYSTKAFERIIRDAAHKREFEFLRDTVNPYSTLYRLERMVALLRRVCPEDTNQEVVERAAYSLLVRELALFDGGEATLAPGVEILTQEQVNKGELDRRLRQRRQQPYVQAHSILADAVGAASAAGAWPGGRRTSSPRSPA